MEDKIREAIMKMGRPEDMPALVVEICNDAWRDLTKQKLMAALDRSNGPNMERRAAVTVAYLNEF